MPTEHSKMASPSGSNRWLNCPGAPNAEKDFPDQSSDAAMDGTITHDLVERCLNKGQFAEEYEGCYGCVNKYGDVYLADGPRDIAVYCAAIDQARVERANLYLDYVRGRMANMQKPKMFVEKKVQANYWAKGCHGTADCVLIDERGIMDVIDLKDGTGIVKPDSPQLKIYGLGAIGPMNAHNIHTINLTIVQPKDEDEPIKTLTLQASDLFKWGDEVLRPGALATQDPNAPRIPGDHCLWCKAEAVCPEKRKGILDEFAVIDLHTHKNIPDPVVAPPDPATLTAAQLDKLLSFLDEFESWMNAVRAEAFRRLDSGDKDAPTIKKLVQGRASRKWAYPEETLREKLDCFLPEFQMHEIKFCSPAKMETAIAARENPRNHDMTKKEIKEALKPFIRTTHGKSMVSIDNPKPALIPGVSDFKGVDLDAVFS